MPILPRLERKFSTVLHIALCGTALAALVACGGRGSDAGRAGDSAASTGRAFRVALLTPGAISDQSWNGGAYQGLLRIRDSLGAQISHIQTKTPAEFEENFRQYGAQGYDLVFGHGFEFQDAAVRVAPDYPKTIYVTTSGNRTGPNVAGIEFAFGDASYLAGILAGAMTKTGVIGTIGGTELPPVQKSFAAFADGAHAVNPSIRVLGSYIGDWNNASAGKEQAIAQIGQRADIIFQNADAAGLGVFQAARERKGVWVIGSNANQNGVAPEVTLGSVVIDLPHAFLSVAREVKDRRFTPRVIYLGTSDDVVQLVLNPATRATIPAATLARIDSLGGLMKSGKLHVEGTAKAQ
jgi:basic membrane lipoprotein Med (substrate-binding protein (PBP1-ABC) superfamily)